jgi:von Willebrand factor type A domain/FHA domain
MRAMILVLSLLAGFAGPALAAEQASLDVVFALDNSGSMQTNDPKRLLHEAVKAFAGRLGPSDQLGIVSFDQGVHTLIELGAVAPGSVDTALRRINYRGAWTDIPGGLEAARYELEHRGRTDAQKVVVLITDGGIDLGAPQKDRERKDWLESSVMPAVLNQGIRVFGIAVAKDADFELIQRMTSSTGGTYYAVTNGKELSRVFDDVSTRLQDLRTQEKTTAQPAQAAAEAQQRADADRRRLADETAQVAQREAEAADAKRRADALVREAQNTAIATNKDLVEAARDAEARASSERRLTIWSVLAVLAVFAGAATIFLWRRRSPKVAVPGARLMDIGGQTGLSEHSIKRAITRIGLLEGQDVRIDATGVSRTHAIIEYKDGGFYLRDLRSTNGTFLNEQRLPGDDTTGRLLKHGDDIRFGPYLFRFVVDELVRAEQGPNPAKTTRVVGGTVRFDQEPAPEPDQAPAYSPDQPLEDAPIAQAIQPNEPRLTVVKPQPDPRAPVGPDDKCDLHQSRKAEARCSRCEGLICAMEEPVADGMGGIACREFVERGTCGRLQVKVA